MTSYAFVPARGGSERLPGKNLAEVGGISLVKRALLRGMQADCRMVLSTDSGAIETEALSVGAVQIHRRPAHMAGPRAQIETAIKHWGRAQGLERSDVVVLLQPTSPLRRVETVRRCVELAHGPQGFGFTVTLDHREPFRGNRANLSDTGLARCVFERPRGWTRPRSQDVRLCPEENGCVYAFRWGHLLDTGSRMGSGVMACVPTPWWEAWEIDEPNDLRVARALWGVFCDK